MFNHMMKDHYGVISDDNGLDDYKMIITDFFTLNLRRQTQEGIRQTTNERYQDQDKVKVMNGFIDFCQPLQTQINVSRKTSSKLPG